MSDLSKIAEMHYRSEQLREFKFRSMLSVFMQEVSKESGVQFYAEELK